MSWRSQTILLLFGAITSWVGLQAPGFGQIVPDATIPRASIVSPAGSTSTITGGSTVGTNLFHSFDRFSVRVGETAWFNQASSIQNIFARITGASASQIDGQLRANGSANLFLLNPNGIVFGANAQLNLGGSFIASTAQSLRFADGAEFSAIAPLQSPLLTISAPIGLQYGANPAPIVVKGPGHNLTVNTTNFSVNRTARSPGLRVQPGQTLALVGGSLDLDGGNLTAENGRVELGAVGAPGQVQLTATNPGWTIGYGGIATFGDLRLAQAASVDTSGSRGGAIRAVGQQISLTGGSTFLATTLGNGQGQGITVQATKSLEVLGFSGTAAAPRFPSSLLTDATVGSTATAQGGPIAIETGALRVMDGGQISASVLAAGNAGDLTVKAQRIELSGGIAPFGASGLFNNVVNRTARGRGGLLQVEAQELVIRDGARISVSTSGIGNAGQLNIQAQSIDLAGRSASFGLSGLFARGSSGNGGNLTIKSDRLRVADGAQIAVSTSGIGNVGNLTVMAKDIELVGTGPTSPSGLFASVSPRASGKGGNLRIEAERLSVRDGAQVSVATGGTGNAGDLTVKAQSIDLSGSSPQGLSGLFATAVIDTGAGGDLNVSTQKLTIREGATISVSNFPSSSSTTAPGRGPAGNIWINAEAISLDNDGKITASTLVGKSGNIAIKSSTLVLQRNSLIATNSKGNESGGNINLQTDFLVGTQNSDITANAVNAQGGQVKITAQRIVGMEVRDRLTPDSDITASSELGVNGTVQAMMIAVDPSLGLEAFPVEVVDPSRNIALACAPGQSRFVATGQGGIPENPSQRLQLDSPWLDARGLRSRPAKGNRQVPKALPLVEATAWHVDRQGQPELVATSMIAPNLNHPTCANSVRRSAVPIAIGNF